MTFRSPTIDWGALTPELILLGGAGVVLIGVLFLPRGARRLVAAVVSAGCLIAAAIVAAVLFAHDGGGWSSIVAGALRRDRLAELAQVLVAGSGLLSIGVLWAEPDDARRERTGEYYALLLTAVAGMCFFVGANNLMTLFLGLEWFSISLYVLCAMAPGRLSSLEAALKYLVVGSFGSAILLFGSALVYGATGSIYFGRIATAAGNDRLLYVAGLAMLLVGLGFKASAAPFHMWTPDVYQGAPTPVTAFMSAATKVAALVLTLRLLTTAFPDEQRLWTIALAVIVCASLAIGNLAALVQSDVKRMLAYSSVSHAGFLLMPVAAGNALGGRALLYYLMSYAAMSVGSFAVVAARERELARPVTFETMGGFGWERPFHGLAMTVFMFGFIGLPPAGLFLGKFYAFAAVIDRGWTWLAIVGVAATVVSIYYYLGLVRMMWFSAPQLRVAQAARPAAVRGGATPRDPALTSTVGLSLAISVATLFAADPLVRVAREAASVLHFPF